eukprot:3772859-Prymnesium_polylepis.1
MLVAKVNQAFDAPVGCHVGCRTTRRTCQPLRGCQPLRVKSKLTLYAGCHNVGSLSNVVLQMMSAGRGAEGPNRPAHHTRAPLASTTGGRGGRAKGQSSLAVEPCSSPINHWGADPSNDTQPITMWARVHCRP